VSGDGVKDETEVLVARADALRSSVEALLSEADRRRHAALDVVNVRRQLRLHPAVALGLAVAAVTLAVALPILGVRRARRRRSFVARASALRDALGRIMKRPDRVAETRIHLPTKVLSAALTAAAGAVARKEIERLFVRRPRPALIAAAPT
jgi:hypothetical protein